MHNPRIPVTPPFKAWKPFSFYVYLLNCNAETTPTSSEEFQLAQAGLGKRHLTMSRDMNHEEVKGINIQIFRLICLCKDHQVCRHHNIDLLLQLFGLLQSEYPKMQGLTGGWLLYKATGRGNKCLLHDSPIICTYVNQIWALLFSGGQGKRKLTLVPPDSECYTGTLIRSMTGNGKNLLYIVPLQQEFDLTPLPPDAVEFKNMPKAQCQTCKVSLPLHILALHVQECTESGSSAEDTEVHTSQNNICIYFNEIALH